MYHKLYSYLYKGYYNAGLNYYKSNNLEKAKKSFLNALLIKKDTLLDPNYVNIHKHLSTIYLKEEKNDSAIYYLNIYTKIHNKALINENKQIIEAYKMDKENAFEKIIR